jgi:hypothetical protein
LTDRDSFTSSGQLNFELKNRIGGFSCDHKVTSTMCPLIWKKRAMKLEWFYVYLFVDSHETARPNIKLRLIIRENRPNINGK